MTTPEKYYTFLDLQWPVNVVITADLDRSLEVEQVARAWQHLRQRRVVTRSVATEDLAVVDPGADEGTDSFEARELPPEEWHEVIGSLSDTPVDLGTPMRCWYLTSPATGRSRLVLVGHHAVVDGRMGVAEIQLLVRALDGQEVPEQQLLAAPPETDPRSWQQDRAGLIDLLRQVKARNTRHGDVFSPPWPEPDVARRSWMRSMVVEEDETRRLASAAREHGANVLSAVAAALLVSTARVLGGADPAGPVTLPFATTTDTSAPASGPDRPPSMAIAVLSQPYRVDPADPWALAAELRATVHEARDRGEGELFFHLSRLAQVTDLEAGRRLVSTAIASSPPCVAVSNLGVTDPGTDPAWLRGPRAQLATAPNQIVFLTISSYRGRLQQLFAFDDRRVPPQQRAAILADYRTTLRSLAHDGGRG